MSVETVPALAEGPRVHQLPSGPDVDIADPELLTEEEYATVARTTSQYRPTEYGNAQRLAVLFGADIRWVQDERAWCVWNGQHWAADTTGELMRRAKTVARILWHELPHLVDSGERRDWIMHAKRSETKRGLQAMIDLAASEKIVATGHVLTCSVEDFDLDLEILNCPNGTLHLSSGVIREHRREDMQRRITVVPYEPEARSPEWENFLLDCTGNDRELVDYLQLLAGASLLGTNRHDVLPVIFGPPGSGKSTFIQALLAPLGPQFAGTANLETFAERSATSNARDDLARLEGLRMVACVEGERNHTLAAGLVKMVTGGDAIAARRLFQSTRTWIPQFTLWIAVNEQPRLHRDEEGLFRRYKAIPFENQVVSVDPNLRSRLSNPNVAGRAVMAWAVAGALRVSALTGPLVDPQVIVDATQEYREEQYYNSLDGWLDDRCQRASDMATTAVSDLRDSYEAWCLDVGTTPVSMKAWGTEMRGQFKTGRTNKARFYRGVTLLGTATVDDDSHP